MPQVSIEFDVADAAAVGPVARELEQAGYELLRPPRKEPWGQTVARLQSPEGAVVGISYVRYSGRGNPGGLQVEPIDAACLFHLHDGKVVKLVLYWDRSRALADLGFAPEAGSAQP